jgi:histidinol-phosphate/aromatic aminotransferase/cobyric acid decarboxylase-like protein
MCCGFATPITPPANCGALIARAIASAISLVICDEAFLSLVPDGEQQSLIPLVSEHPNLVVIAASPSSMASLALRLGYAVAQPERLQRWAQWRDPWPVNGIASAVAEQLLASPAKYQRWCRRAQSLGCQGGRLDAAAIGSVAWHHADALGGELFANPGGSVVGSAAGSG